MQGATKLFFAFSFVFPFHIMSGNCVRIELNWISCNHGIKFVNSLTEQWPKTRKNTLTLENRKNFKPMNKSANFAKWQLVTKNGPIPRVTCVPSLSQNIKITMASPNSGCIWGVKLWRQPCMTFLTKPKIHQKFGTSQTKAATSWDETSKSLFHQNFPAFFLFFHGFSWKNGKQQAELRILTEGPFQPPWFLSERAFKIFCFMRSLFLARNKIFLGIS